MRARILAGLALGACLALLIATAPLSGAIVTAPQSAVTVRTEGAGLPSPPDTTADDVEVHILPQEGNDDVPYIFSPTALTVAAGTTVRWYNHTDAYHTVTTTDSLTVEQPNGVIRQTLVYPGDTVAYTFVTPGTYYYYCEPHADFMTGTITVTG